MNRTDGRRFEGIWKDGKRSGDGVMYYPDGTQERAEYKEDVKIRTIRERSYVKM